MIVPLRHLLGWIVSAFSSREDLILENLALRQQLLTLHATRPRRRLRARRVGAGRHVSKEARALIFRMVAENPTSGAPRIHGELLKLGFDLASLRWSRKAQSN